MNRQTWGFNLSFLFHATTIFIFVAMGRFIEAEQKPLVIDFSIKSGSQESGGGSPLPQKAEEKSDPMKPLAKQREVVQAKPVEIPAPIAEAMAQVQEESPVSVPFEEKPVKTAETMAGLVSPTNNFLVQPALTSEGGSGGLGSTGIGEAPGSIKGGSVENAKRLYLKEHFAYIRDMIMKYVSYPHVARKRGWTGKVVVSFIVSEKGLVNDIRIVESSGFPILDNNAIETIKKAAPFPKPPVRAELVMPIVYKIL